RLIERLRHDHFDVRVACWVNPSEEGQWQLYIASRTVDEQGPAAAYRQVHGTMRALDGLRIDPFQVRLVNVKDPVARDVLDMQRRSPGRGPSRYRGARLGNLSIEEAYIYPSVKPKTSWVDALAVGKVRLKTSVEQVPRLDELLRRLTPEEKDTIERLVAG